MSGDYLIIYLQESVIHIHESDFSIILYLKNMKVLISHEYATVYEVHREKLCTLAKSCAKNGVF